MGDPVISGRSHRQRVGGRGIRIKEKSATLEDLLATDSLFIEYFNSYLALPSFPEPLQFNKETGGFEIINNARKHLASEIKAAVRATRRRKRIYRPVHSHSYSTIPLIPMEDPPEQKEQEIDTTFTVKSLNREQGIEWIKRERMPAFLESDCYVEYRLAKLVSQSEKAFKGDHFLSVRIDYAPPPPKREKVEIIEEPEEDETDVLMRDMYVSLGNTSTTDTETWVSHAKSALHTQTTDSKTRPISAVSATVSDRPSGNVSRSVIGRPGSAVSGRKARNKSAASERDSGIWSPMKSSMLDGSEGFGQTDPEIGEHCVSFEDDAPIQSLLFDPDNKPIAPRPADLVYVMAGEEGEVEKGERAYNTPRLPTPPPSDDDDDDNDSEGYCSNNNTPVEDGNSDGEILPGEPIVFETIEELGGLIVATALKYALSTVCDVSIKQLEADPDLTQFFPHKKYQRFTKEDITHTEFILGSQAHARRVRQEHRRQETVTEVPEELSEATPSDSDSVIALGKDDSDEDSLLNSDEDYEEGRDEFFHKKEHKLFTLTTRKGLRKFRAFLKGTLGVKNWNLWLDIERAKSIKDPTEQTNYLLAMRERYLKHGGAYELSTEMKAELNLALPSHWTLDKLTAVQTRIAEPLIVYWAPRFMIRQQVHVNPDRHYLYHHLKLIQPSESPYPNPPVTPLLPLRPKTCIPRVRKANDVQINDLFSEQSFMDAASETKPPVGNKRVYDLPDMFAPFNDKKEKESRNKERKKANCPKTPRQLISSKMSVRRPPSAPASIRSHRRSLRDVWGSTNSLDSVSIMRPSSASSMRSGISEASDMTEFMGGRRMEGLLQALASEKSSGSFFKKHIDKSKNKLWKNSLRCWQGLQTYHNIFYSEKLDPFLLENKAKFLYSQYVVIGAPCGIQCKPSIRNQVHDKINPPFEELFDPVEEYILTVLFDAWTHSLSEDITTFDKVELQDVKRHLDTKSRYVTSLQKRGIIKERVETPEDSMDGYQDPVYDDALWDDIPAEFHNFGLEKLVHNRIELEHLRQFLAENYASMDLMCWMDIEAFRRIPHTEEKRRDLKANDVKVKYFNKKYFFGPNSPAGKEGQEKVMKAGGGWGKLLHDRPPTSCLLEAQKYVQERLEKKWLPLFLATEAFYDRQRPQSGMGDVVEDVMIQRKKKSQAIWKMLESKWVSSSKDILTFRKALSNPVTSFHFRRFLSAKFHGEHFFENDVLFWQEVQRYKDLCHVHSDRSLIQQKTSAITNCFIDSPIPPSLQVDITQDMADKILERKLEATPYLFREAQLTVFRVLFTKWQEFCQFRNQITEDKMLPTLERLRKKNVVAEKKRLRESEEKQQRELRRRQELGLPVGGTDEEGADAGYSDIFRSAGGASEDGTLENMDNKDNMTWSYSQYIQALDREEVLNNVDEMTFSCLTLNSQGHADINDDLESEAGDRASVAPSLGQKPNYDGKKPKKETRMSSRLEEDVDGTVIKTPSKPIVDTPETGSQAELKSRKPQRISSAKQDPVKPFKSDGRTSPPATKQLAPVKMPVTQTTVPVHAKTSPITPVTMTTPQTSHPRLERRIPPLVQKRL